MDVVVHVTEKVTEFTHSLPGHTVDVLQSCILYFEQKHLATDSQLIVI